MTMRATRGWPRLFLMSLAAVTAAGLAFGGPASALAAPHEPTPDEPAEQTEEVLVLDDVVVIEWATLDEAATYVTWGIDSDLEFARYVGFGQQHRVELDDLECGTIYQARQWSFVSRGPLLSHRLTISTLPCPAPIEPDPEPEPEPLVIEAAEVTSTTKDRAAIGVTSSVPATAQLTVRNEIGALVSQAQDERVVSSRLLGVSGLECGTSYLATVILTTADGEQTASTADIEVATTSCAVPEAGTPAINADQDSVELSWSTDVRATARVQIDDGDTLREHAANTDFSGQGHRAVVEGLQCDTLHRARVLADTADLSTIDSRWYQFVTSPCANDASLDHTPRLLAMGDGLMLGDGTTETFRAVLHSDLDDAGADVAFVGPLFGHPWRGHSDPEAGHHLAIAGASSTELAAQADIASLLRPDAVLLHFGNEAIAAGATADEVVEGIAEIVLALRLADPEIDVVVGEIVGCEACATSDALRDANDQLTWLVDAWSTDDSAVTLARFPGLDAALHTQDGLAPNASGDRFLADGWRAALAAPSLAVI